MPEIALSLCPNGVPSLLSGALAMWGSSVIGYYAPEDAVLGAGAVVNSQPGRIGATLAQSQNKYVQTALNGRAFLLASAPGYYLLSGNCTGQIKTLITVASTPTLPLARSLQVMLMNNATGAILGSSAGTSALYDGGWRNYIDGVETRALTAGVHSYAATNAGQTSVVLWHGHSSNTVWEGATGVKIALSVAAAPADIATFHATVLKPYYGLLS